MRKIQSLTIDEQIVLKLEKYAKDNFITKSRAAEKILKRFLSVEYPVELTTADSAFVKSETEDQKFEKKMLEECPYLPGEKEALEGEAREWELYMVARGDFHTGFAENPPIYDLMPGKKPIYLTPDGKSRDGRIFEGETGPYPQFPTPLADARRAKEEEYKKKQKEEAERELEAPREETQQEMEDREFEESLAMSIAE